MKLFPFLNKPKIKVDKNIHSNRVKMNNIEILGSRDTAVDPDKRGNKDNYKGGEEKRDEASDHFESLKHSAELVNKELQSKNSPYRFYIYREFENIFINLVILDDEGKVVEVKKKNITHQEFSQWIRHIESGEGLFFDSVG